MFNPLDYTKGGSDDLVQIYVEEKPLTVKKKDIHPSELYETGVYNSELDVYSNPKTSENKPNKTASTLSAIGDKVEEILYSLSDLRTFIKDNSTVSHKIVDSAIADFKSYLTSLENETEETSAGSVN